MSQLNEEHNAIKVHYSSGDAERPGTPAVALYVRTDDMSVRLTKLPSELTIKTDDRFDQRWERRKLFSDDLDKLRLKNKGAYEELAEQFFNMISFSEIEEKHTAQLNAEMEELFSHITTLLKSRMIEYVHDLRAAEEANFAVQSRVFRAALDKALAEHQ